MHWSIVTVSVAHNLCVAWRLVFQSVVWLLFLNFKSALSLLFEARWGFDWHGTRLQVKFSWGYIFVGVLQHNVSYCIFGGKASSLFGRFLFIDALRNVSFWCYGRQRLLFSYFWLIMKVFLGVRSQVYLFYQRVVWGGLGTAFFWKISWRSDLGWKWASKHAAIIYLAGAILEFINSIVTRFGGLFIFALRGWIFVKNLPRYFRSTSRLFVRIYLQNMASVWWRVFFLLRDCLSSYCLIVWIVTSPIISSRSGWDWHFSSYIINFTVNL